MEDRRLIIAGTGSGIGKTTLTIGLMAALHQKGYVVQGFKCGPDYIDPTYHTAVTGRPSRNLDSWMLTEQTLKEVYKKGSEGADISIIEGVMGLFDGRDPRSNQGSTAEISLMMENPVLLVVNCGNVARSAAAIVKGFQCLDENIQIVGVIANQVGSEGHFQLVKAAIEQECHVPVVGYLQQDENLTIPERHLGLIPSVERGELDSFFSQLGQRIAETIDLDQVIEISRCSPLLSKGTSLFTKKLDPHVRIAVARDEAFNFYYPENLELLEANGASIVEFSPVQGEPLPDNVHGLYIGGGFPEEFAGELAKHKNVQYSILQAVRSGLPTLAECGGFMYLTEYIQTTDGFKHPMVGLIPGQVEMKNRLTAIGYREVEGAEGNFLLSHKQGAKGHEFHYAVFNPGTEIHNFPYAYQTKGMGNTYKEGYLTKNLVSGFTHLHFASCPQLANQWIKVCAEYKELQGQGSKSKENAYE